MLVRPGTPFLLEEFKELHKHELWGRVGLGTSAAGQATRGSSGAAPPRAAAPAPSGAGRAFADLPGPGRGAGAGPCGAATRGPRARPTWGRAERQGRFERPRRAFLPAWQPPVERSSTFPSPAPQPPGRSPGPARRRRGSEQRPPRGGTKHPVRLPQPNGGAKHPFPQPGPPTPKKIPGPLRGRPRKPSLPRRQPGRATAAGSGNQA